MEKIGGGGGIEGGVGVRVNVNKEYIFWGKMQKSWGRGSVRLISEVYVKIHKKNQGVGVESGGRGSGQGGSEQRIEVFVKIQKKIGGGGSRSGWGGQGGCE